MKKYHRRQYILKDTSQPKYIFSYFILFCLGLFLFSIIFSFLSMETTTITYFDNQVSVGHTPAMLIKNLMGSGWIIITVGGGLLFIISIIMTHRVAGPAYRIDKSLEKMLKGEFGFPIRLRAKDELKPIASKLEELSITLNTRNKKIITALEEMDKIIVSISDDDDSKSLLNEKIKTIREALR